MVRGRVWRWVCPALAGGLWLVSASAVLPGGPAADLVSLGVGALPGTVLAGGQRHLVRRFAAVPFGCTALVVALVWTALAPSFWSTFVLGLAGGLLVVPLVAVVRERNWWLGVLLLFLFPSIVALQRAGIPGSGNAALWVCLVLSGPCTIMAWWVFLREWFEQIVELLLWPCYRIRLHGPGAGCVPERGPLIVIANHAAWLDPVWLIKALPLRLTPLMTSLYFDRPVLRWLMTHVVPAIRVQAGGFRRETPEIEQAVQVLNRGEAVLLFPEGMVRRREDVLLRAFGQGTWRMLRERPATPVLICWIEGGWGSFTSYANGPPLRNKPLDRRRPIDIAVCEPRVLSPELLADQRATREYLWKACLDARRHLGIETRAEERMEDEGGEEQG
jgi:1-acyl-sn-glycerol-3-phosphate acyltransferase